MSIYIALLLLVALAVLAPFLGVDSRFDSRPSAPLWPGARRRHGSHHRHA